MHCSRVDAFRHRAALIIVDPGAAGYGNPELTLTPAGYRHQNACRATKVIRHGLWPIFTARRVAVNPQFASLAVMSASL